MSAYRLLLRLYPASFRDEYGSELAMLHERRRREAAFAPAFWLRETADAVWNAGLVHLDVLRQDVRFSLRSLRRAPGFTATAVLVTALGIGANTAVFSVADRVLVRPLPFRDSERIVMLYESVPGYSRMELSPPNFADWKRQATSFEDMSAYYTNAVNLVGEGEPQRVECAYVGAGLIPLLGASPFLGRLLGPEDETPGAPRALVLSYGLWRSQFGGAFDVVGRGVRLDDETYTVAGVMPANFRFPDLETRVWLPIRLQPDDLADRDNNFLYGVARLRSGVTLETAQAEMQRVAENLERAYPKENEKTRATVVPMRDQVPSQVRLLLLALFGGAACVLLISCSNLASLMLSRALQRRRELGVRAALGAGRERLVRQMLTESLLLAAAGGTLGVLVAISLAPLLARLVPARLPISDLGSIDPRVLAFAALLTLATGIAFGVVPALRSASGTADDLRSGPRAGLGRRRERLRPALVAAQITASVALVVVAGLLMRAVWRVQAVDPGFRSGGVVTLRTALPQPRYAEVARRERLYRQILSDVEALGGVQRAAYTSFLPLVMRGGIWPVVVNGAVADRREGQTASLRFVTPGYFEAMGIPLVRGRGVGEADTREALGVAVVSESFASHYWPGEDALGRRFSMAFAERTIVGVVGDVRVRGLERESEPQVYLPSGQVNDDSLSFYTPKDLVVRSTLPPEALVPALRRIVAAADPELPVSDVRTLGEIVEADSGARLSQVRVLGTFAALALVLSGLGLHGLLSYAVGQRVPEIGLRLALGARPGDILRMVAGDGLRLAAIGCVLGVALALVAGRSMQALLFGIAPADPAVATAALLLAAICVASGTLLPALRAVRVDPTIALKADV
jgi:predicted permease